ncbi:MAG: hypothetical protein ACRYGR_02550 [Janthinobacterium lividum]
MNTCWRHILFNLGLFLSVNFSLNSSDLKPEDKVRWVPNLNFTYEDKDISVSSGKNIDWHAAQADSLFRAYNYCQGKEDGGNAQGRRNVLKANFQIIYSIDKKYYYTFHVPIEEVFINGLEITDNKLPALHSRENIDLRKKFTSLKDHISDPSGAIKKTVAEKIKELGGLNENDLKNVGNVQKRLNSFDFKKNWHSEQTLLIYLSQNIDKIVDSMIKNMGKDKSIFIHDFILNIASIKDMCPKCANCLVKETNNKKLFVKSLKNKLSEIYSVTEGSSLIVLASGISPYGEKSESTRSNIDKFSSDDRLNLLKLPLKDKLVYHIENPYGVATFPRLINLWSY